MTGRTDTERLEWLEANKLQIGFHQFGAVPEQRLNKWAVWNCSGSRCQKLSSSDSMRTAIDSAMERETHD
ncbi:hypothetical protein JRX38_01115 [Gluconobacter cerinus]|uniref:hypothetical protein n=1 Tax=Gluconobacter cerinus TaxID=38307 RepID=UPI00193F6FB0|nr:hypothetical protein [Gluconobacter cerinus]MBM3096635.1 hypothetical protein [Gluconobacter cerinus]